MKYRAFLSYSHADSAFAEAFHKDLEGWRADRSLIGRTTEQGEVPYDLRPIFRDRDDFAGGRTLGEATLEALEASDFLILLCSPDAAQSSYVNEEVRAFKALGRAGRIIPVIIAGEPGSGDENCFPEALLRKVGPDGELTDQIEERLAADAREKGDGPRRALAKVIAGLLGVPFDEIVRRAERAQRRRVHIFAAVAISMTVLAAAAGAFGWLAETRRVAAERNYEAAISAADSMLGQVGEELIRTEGVGLETTKRILGRSEAIYDELLISLPDATEVTAGKIAALSIFSRAYFAKGDTKAADEALAEAERLLLTFLADEPGPAEKAPPLALLRAERAKLLASIGDYEGAAERYRLSLEVLSDDEYLAEAGESEARLAVGAAIQYGLVLSSLGKGDAAARTLRAAISIIDEWSPKSNAEQDWLMIKNAALAAGAEIDRGAGDLRAARVNILKSVAEVDAFVERNPDVAGVKILLASLLREAANLGMQLGLEDAAVDEIARADAVLADVAAADRENVSAQIQVGGREIERAVDMVDAGDVATAVPRLTAELSELEAQWRAAPEMAIANETARYAFGIAADAFNRAGYHSEALNAALFLIEMERTAVDPDAELRLMIAYNRARTAEQARENYAAALVHAEAALEIERRLSANDLSRGRRLADAEWASGLLLWYLSRRDEAEARYVRIVELFGALLAENPKDVGLGSSFSWTCVNLGELKALNGDAAGAREVFGACLLNAERVLALAPNDRNVILDLVWSEARVALIDNDAARWRRVERLLSEADEAEPLDDLEDELLTVARIAIAGR